MRFGFIPAFTKPVDYGIYLQSIQIILALITIFLHVHKTFLIRPPKPKHVLASMQEKIPLLASSVESIGVLLSDN